MAEGKPEKKEQEEPLPWWIWLLVGMWAMSVMLAVLDHFVPFFPGWHVDKPSEPFFDPDEEIFNTMHSAYIGDDGDEDYIRELGGN